MRPRVPQHDDPVVLDIIRAAARKHNVHVRVALAFAWCESKLNPRAAGDLEWHQKRNGALYRQLVVNSLKFRENPYRHTPELWHSYGLYQLLAVYHVGGKEDPRTLYDAKINAERGCREIARLLRLTGGDVVSARLAYIGCGIGGALCAESVCADATQRLNDALLRYAHEGSV